MYSDLFSQKSVQDLLTVLPSLPLAVWETFYVTVVSTALSLVIGLPLGVLLVVGEKNGVLPLPRWLMQVLNVIINLLRSIPFLILMIMVFPLSRLLIGTAVGTTATIVPLVAAAFPFVARLVESSLREVDGNIIGPKILGNSTGLSSFWVLFAILLFGGLWGFVGMIVGVPLFAVIYDVIKKLVFHGLRRNGQLDQMTVYHDEFGDPGDPAPAPVEDEETETEIVIDSGEE